MRIIVAGAGRLTSVVLATLLKSNHEVIGSIQDGRSARFLKQVLAPAYARLRLPPENPISASRANRIPIFWLKSMDEKEVAPLLSLNPDLVIASGTSLIFRPALLEAPNLGCMNIHPSLLPTYRGPNPITRCILGGETKTGVTFHVMEKGVDTGDIIKQISFPIQAEDCFEDVASHTSNCIRDNLIDVLDSIQERGFCGSEQDDSVASYQSKLTLEERRIRWDRPAEEIDRLVRACPFSQSAFFQHRNIQVFVHKTSYLQGAADCPPGTVLDIEPHIGVATGSGIVVIESLEEGGRFHTIRPNRSFDVGLGEKLS